MTVYIAIIHLDSRSPRRGEFLIAILDDGHKDPLVILKVSHTFVNNHGTHGYCLLQLAIN